MSEQRIKRMVALCSPSVADAVASKARALSQRVQVFASAQPALVVAEGVEPALEQTWRGQHGVVDVRLEPTQTLLAGRTVHPADHVVTVGRDVQIGGGAFAVIAGPCGVETREQILEAAQQVRLCGAHLLRGGAYKPRTSPYAFQGLGAEGLSLLEEASAQSGLGIVTEVVDTADVERVALIADMLQVGARNMQNFALLKALGSAQKPVLLKRGFGCTIQELLCAAEYICAHGNADVVLCERGVRSFDQQTRFLFDVSAIAVLKERSRLPVIADPSHATGSSKLIAPVARAALAAGADGVMVEMHCNPSQALSDGEQALLPAALAELNAELAALCTALGRSFGSTANAGGTATLHAGQSQQVTANIERGTPRRGGLLEVSP